MQFRGFMLSYDSSYWMYIKL